MRAMRRGAPELARQVPREPGGFLRAKGRSAASRQNRRANPFIRMTGYHDGRTFFDEEARPGAFGRKKQGRADEITGQLYFNKALSAERALERDERENSVPAHHFRQL